MSKTKIKRKGGNGVSNTSKQVKAAMDQLKLTLPQALALLQETKIVNLQLKVANNALVGEVNRTFEEARCRIEALEQKVFGTVQGEPLNIAGDSTEAMKLPTEQAKKDAALLQSIQSEIAKPKDTPPVEEEKIKEATSKPLGGPVGEPEEEEGNNEAEEGIPNFSTSMFPRSN